MLYCVGDDHIVLVFGMTAVCFCYVVFGNRDYKVSVYSIILCSVLYLCFCYIVSKMTKQRSLLQEWTWSSIGGRWVKPDGKDVTSYVHIN